MAPNVFGVVGVVTGSHHDHRRRDPIPGQKLTTAPDAGVACDAWVQHIRSHVFLFDARTEQRPNYVTL
jgi:hypothetical protein